MVFSTTLMKFAPALLTAAVSHFDIGGIGLRLTMAATLLNNLFISPTQKQSTWRHTIHFHSQPERHGILARLRQHPGGRCGDPAPSHRRIMDV